MALAPYTMKRFLKLLGGRYEEIAVDILKTPGELLWATSTSEIIKEYNEIKTKILKDHYKLLDLSLLSHILLSKKQLPLEEPEILEILPSIEEVTLFNPHDLTSMIRWDWTTGKVPVVKENGDPQLVHFLIATHSQPDKQGIAYPE